MIVNTAVPDLIRWMEGTTSRVYAIDSLIPWSFSMSSRGYDRIMVEFRDHDIVLPPNT